MAISFLKLDVNIMNDEKIKLIRQLNGGDSYFVLWIGILCLAMKSGKPGVLEIGDNMPYTNEMISAVLGVDIFTVDEGMQWFQKMDMVEMIKDVYFVKNFELHQKLDLIEKKRLADRTRQQERRKRLKAEKEQSTQDLSRDCHATVVPQTLDIDKDIDKERYTVIIDYLNGKAGTAYKHSKNTIQHINARMAEGYTVDDFKKVIDIKCSQWLGGDMAKYLRPSTLFSPSKFEGYLNEQPSEQEDPLYKKHTCEKCGSTNTINQNPGYFCRDCKNYV